MRFVDTNIWIDFLRGRLPYVLKMFQENNPRDFAVPSIVKAELEYGAQHSSSPQRSLEATHSLIRPFEIISFDDNCARYYGKIRNNLAKQGKLIGGNDMLIAATALAYDATLVTNNVNEFSRIPSLKIEAWSESSI